MVQTHWWFLMPIIEWLQFCSCFLIRWILLKCDRLGIFLLRWSCCCIVSIFAAFAHCFPEGTDSNIFLLEAEIFNKWVGISPPTSFLHEGCSLQSSVLSDHSSDCYAGVGHCLFLGSSLHDTVQASRSHHLSANRGLLHEELGAINFLCVLVVGVGLALRKWQGWEQNIEILP